jgi:hypothetical protein
VPVSLPVDRNAMPNCASSNHSPPAAECIIEVPFLPHIPRSRSRAREADLGWGLPEAFAHTKAQYHKSKYALRAAAMLHGGVDPGLLDEVQWWRSDDLWYWSRRR